MIRREYTFLAEGKYIPEDMFRERFNADAFVFLRVRHATC